MLKRLSLEKIELLLASVMSLAILKLAVDLPNNGPCSFFFVEPEYPINEY